MTDLSDPQAGELLGGWGDGRLMGGIAAAPTEPAPLALRDVYYPNRWPRQDCVHYLYQLLRERSTEEERHVNISHSALPPWHEHVDFIRSNPYRAWYVIHAEQPIGTVYATNANEIGIVLGKAHRGQGHGTRAVRMMLERLPPLPEVKGVRRGCWLANINPANAPSIHMFEKLGARHISNTYELP